jgi:hypothetical protein
MNILSLLKADAVDVFSNWIEVKDLVHLDSVFCNMTGREFLPDIFKKEYFTLGEIPTSTKGLKYVNIRKLKLKTLSLIDSFGFSRQLIRDLNISKVRKLKIDGCRMWKLPRAELVSLFNDCPMLTELELNDVQCCCDDVIIQFNPIILSQLTRISITVNGITHFSQTAIQRFAIHCCLLQSVQLTFQRHCVSSAVLLQLAETNLQLMDFNLNWKECRYDVYESLLVN